MYILWWYDKTANVAALLQHSLVQRSKKWAVTWHINSVARLSKPIYLEVKSKVSMSKELSIVSHCVGKLCSWTFGLNGSLCQFRCQVELSIIGLLMHLTNSIQSHSCQCNRGALFSQFSHSSTASCCSSLHLANLLLMWQKGWCCWFLRNLPFWRVAHLRVLVQLICRLIFRMMLLYLNNHILLLRKTTVCNLIHVAYFSLSLFDISGCRLHYLTFCLSSVPGTGK